jgi:hypothetical protein
LFNREHGQDPVESVRSGDEAYRLTEEASRLFFEYARFQMLRGAILDLCSFCDPDPRSLTLARILQTTDLSSRPDLQWRATHAKKQAYKKVHKGGIWQLRSKEVAHLDLATAVGAKSAVGIVASLDVATRWVVDFQRVVIAGRDKTPYDPEFARRDVGECEWRASVDSLIQVLRLGLDAMTPEERLRCK